MSAIETVQKAYAAFGQGDMETLTTLMSDDYVAILPESMPNGGTFNGANDFIQNCYMDNRLGVWNALKVAETLEDGVIVFSCWEETGGGSVGYLGKYIYEKWGIRQALISDITWVTEGVSHGKGVAISMRDSGIPRKSYVRKIIDIATKNMIQFQLEVEDAGGSDGNSLQKSSYPFDWCFVGAPEDNVHTPNERVHKGDINEMVRLYKVLMKKL